ncbi:MAG: hypothetical protein WAN75_50565, partial [Xanthobacteraceae bacterium]
MVSHGRGSLALVWPHAVPCRLAVPCRMWRGFGDVAGIAPHAANGMGRDGGMGSNGHNVPCA